MIVLCRTANASTYSGYHPVDAMVGEMDWYAELHRILDEEVFKKVENKPNDRQIGGQHYREIDSEYQHWDLVVDFDMCYFTGNLTKYVVRWRKKNGVRDLEKAMHYLDKLISLYSEGRRQFENSNLTAPPLSKLYKFCEQHGLSFAETEVVAMAATYCTAADLHVLRAQLAAVLAHAQTVTTAATLPSTVPRPKSDPTAHSASPPTLKP